MDLNIRDWMLIIGVLLLSALILDACRRVRNERRRNVRLSKNAKRMQKVKPDAPLAELPNGVLG